MGGVARPLSSAVPHMTHLPLGLLQPGPEFPLLPLKGGTAPLQLLPFLQQLRKVILQLPLLLLQLKHLQLQQLLRPLCPGCPVSSQHLPLLLPGPLPVLVHLRARGQTWVLTAPQTSSFRPPNSPVTNCSGGPPARAQGGEIPLNSDNIVINNSNDYL